MCLGESNNFLKSIIPQDNVFHETITQLQNSISQPSQLTLDGKFTQIPIICETQVIPQSLVGPIEKTTN